MLKVWKIEIFRDLISFKKMQVCYNSASPHSKIDNEPYKGKIQKPKKREEWILEKINVQ